VRVYPKAVYQQWWEKRVEARKRRHGPALFLLVRQAVVAIVVALVDILEDVATVERLLGLGRPGRETDVLEAVGADADRGEDVLEGEVAQEGERVVVLRVKRDGVGSGEAGGKGVEREGPNVQTRSGSECCRQQRMDEQARRWPGCEVGGKGEGGWVGARRRASASRCRAPRATRLKLLPAVLGTNLGHRVSRCHSSSVAWSEARRQQLVGERERRRRRSRADDDDDGGRVPLRAARASRFPRARRAFQP
jgi:hypothetical protein